MNSDANSLRSMRCPNCGAPLDFQPGQTSVNCRFCGSTIEHSPDALTAADQARVVSSDPPANPAPGVSNVQGKRFVIKMRNGTPVVLDASDATDTPMMGSGVQSWPSSMSAGNVTSMPVITATPRPSGSSNLGCLIGVVIAALVACGIGAALLASSPRAGLIINDVMSGNIPDALAAVGSLGSAPQVGNSGIVVPGANDGPPEAFLLTAEYFENSGTEHRIIDLNIGTRKLVWQTAPLDPKLYSAPIFVDASRVYFLSGQQLTALNRTDGSVAWQASLADTVQLNICANCIQLVGTHLVALSDDGTLESFDTATGQSQWNAHAQQDSPRGLYVLGGKVAFMDRDADIHGVLRVFDLDSGKETSVIPQCQTSGQDYTAYADWTTPIRISPDGKDFYLFFGASPQCAQRWDAQSLKMDWTVNLPDSFAGSVDSLETVFSDNQVFAAKDSGVLVVAISDGTLGTPITDPDYNFNVIGTHGDDVLLSAERTRGTNRSEIWAVNGTTSQVHWKFILEGTKPMELGGIIDDDTPQWLAVPSAAGVRIIRFQSASDNKSYAILQDVLDWDTGKTNGQKRTALSLDTIILNAPDWISWKNDVAWMEMNQELLSFDANQNKITYQWP